MTEPKEPTTVNINKPAAVNISNPPPGAERSPVWCPSWSITGRPKIPVVAQAERELLMLIEFAAPHPSWHRLASLVTALVQRAEPDAFAGFGSPAQESKPLAPRCCAWRLADGCTWVYEVGAVPGQPPEPGAIQCELRAAHYEAAPHTVDCPHRNIVDMNADWARCEDCGDTSFPISDRAAGYQTTEDRPPQSFAEVLTSPAMRDLVADGIIARLNEPVHPLSATPEPTPPGDAHPLATPATWQTPTADPQPTKPNAIDPDAAALWSLLDDIDTLDDVVKAGDGTFRIKTRDILRKRFDILTSDGYKLAKVENTTKLRADLDARVGVVYRAQELIKHWRDQQGFNVAMIDALGQAVDEMPQYHDVKMGEEALLAMANWTSLPPELAEQVQRAKARESVRKERDKLAEAFGNHALRALHEILECATESTPNISEVYDDVARGKGRGYVDRVREVVVTLRGNTTRAQKEADEARGEADRARKRAAMVATWWEASKARVKEAEREAVEARAHAVRMSETAHRASENARKLEVLLDIATKIPEVIPPLADGTAEISGDLHWRRDGKDLGHVVMDPAFRGIEALTSGCAFRDWAHRLVTERDAARAELARMKLEREEWTRTFTATRPPPQPPQFLPQPTHVFGGVTTVTTGMAPFYAPGVEEAITGSAPEKARIKLEPPPTATEKEVGMIGAWKRSHDPAWCPKCGRSHTSSECQP